MKSQIRKSFSFKINLFFFSHSQAPKKKKGAGK